MVKLSVIIPVYNVEKYIDECVSSVLNQTLRDIEIILVDDESPDKCPILCDEYSKMDSRVKVIHKKNSGLGFARNSGIEVATGEYVTFLDSDDFVDLDAYESLVNIAESNNLDVLYYKFKRFSDVNEVDETVKSDSIVLYEEEAVKNLMLDIIAAPLSSKADRNIQCSSCTAIYRLNVINDHNVRFHSERELISEDLIFNLDFLSYANRAAYNMTRYYHYRINGVSLTQTVRTDRIEKNLVLYEYINAHIPFWNLDSDKGKERNQRLFIGYSRTSVKHLLRSTYPHRRQWFNEICDMPIWTELYENFNWRRLPIYQRLFFILCFYKCWFCIRILSYK